MAQAAQAAPPSVDELYSALEAADKAGNRADAQQLADWIHEMQGAQAPAAQDQSWTRYPKLLGNALTKGLAATAGLAGDVGGLPEALLPSGVAHDDWAPVPGIGEGLTPSNVPTSENIMRATNALGLTNRPEAMPTGGVERYGSAAVSGATAGLFGGLPGMIAGGAGGIAGEAAHDAMPDSAWAPPVAGLVTGLAAAGGVAGVKNFLKARAARSALELAEHNHIAASENAFMGSRSIPEELRATREASRQELEAAKADLQVGHDTAVSNADMGAAGVASQLGSSSTLQEAGQQLQAGARQWITEVLPQKLENIWQPLDSAISPDTPTELKHFGAALKGINTSAGELEPLAGMLKPRLPAQLGKSLDAIIDSRALSGETSTAFNWGDVRNIRTALGDALTNPSIIKDVGEKNLNRLYAGLSEDLRGVAHSEGLGDAFDQANAASRELYNRANGPIAKLVAGGRASAEDAKPEDVAKRLLSGGKAGASDLAVLKEEMPEAFGHLGAVAARDLSSWTKLSPEAKFQLAGPEHSQALDEFAARQQIAKEELASGKKTAADNHRARSDEATAAASGKKHDNALMVRTTREALAEAKEAIPQRAPLMDLRHLGGHTTGGLVGGAAAVPLSYLLDIPGSEIMHGAIGTGLGLGLPLAYRAGRGLIQSPDLLRYPFAATQGARANELMPASGQ